MSRQEAYGYAVARLRAMELRLLDAGVIQRMADAEDAASVLKVLGETSYASSLAGQTGDVDFDKALETELLNTYSEVETFVPDKPLVDLMRMQYDFHNVKVLIKGLFSSKSGGKKRLDLLTSLGSYPVDALISAVETEDYKLLPFGLNTMIPQCVAVMEQSGSPLEAERLLDGRMYDAMFELSSGLNMPGVVKWVRLRIDGENIRSALRLKRFGFDAASAMPYMHGHGIIDVSAVTALIAEPFDTWGRAIEYSDLAKVVNGLDPSEGFSQLILLLEKALDDFYLDSISVYRCMQAAPENVPLYLWTKEMEVKNVRTILVSKTSSGNGDQLRRLLRHGC